VTAARAAALGALLVAVVVVAVLLLSGGSTTTYHLRFINAGQLVKDDDVQIGGRRVGSVRAITLIDNNQADIKIALDNAYAPLHEGTTAIIRATSLSGIANRYIALTPGPNNRPKLDDGAMLLGDSTTSIVDLDQIFDTLNARTRKSLEEVIQGSATWYDNRGKQANAAAKYFNPALSSSRRLVNQVIANQQTFQDFLRSSSRVTTALAQRAPTITALVSNANTTAAAIGDENASLARALGLLPGTLRKANSTFVDLRSTLDDLDTLVNASKPATKDLAKFLQQLQPLLARARPTISDLSDAVRLPGPANDFTNILQQAPALENAARPAFAHSIAALQQSTPVLKFIRPYTPEFVGWLRDFGQVAAPYDANGHYARISPAFNNYQYKETPSGPQLTPTNPVDDKLTGYQTGITNRCPGSASQAPTDGSAPWPDTGGTLDCNPNLVPPGP